MPRTVLVLFCKEPRPGYGKQRLAATVGEAAALEVALALCECALEDIADWSGPSVIAVASAPEAAWAEALIGRPDLRGSDVSAAVQSAGNLGARLAEMDSRLRQGGADRVAFMGSDAPALAPDHFARLQSAMDSHDVALADGDDGGVTLMASRRGWPRLDDLPWSTRRLGDALAAACEDSGRSVARFDGGLDLDEAADIAPLLEALAGDPRPARRALVSLLTSISLPAQ